MPSPLPCPVLGVVKAQNLIKEGQFYPFPAWRKKCNRSVGIWRGVCYTGRVSAPWGMGPRMVEGKSAA